MDILQPFFRQMTCVTYLGARENQRFSQKDPRCHRCAWGDGEGQMWHLWWGNKSGDDMSVGVWHVGGGGGKAKVFFKGSEVITCDVVTHWPQDVWVWSYNRVAGNDLLCSWVTGIVFPDSTRQSSHLYPIMHWSSDPMATQLAWMTSRPRRW